MGEVWLFMMREGRCIQCLFKIEIIKLEMQRLNQFAFYCEGIGHLTCLFLASVCWEEKKRAHENLPKQTWSNII